MKIEDLAKLIELEAMNIREIIHNYKVNDYWMRGCNKTTVQRACVELRNHLMQLSKEFDKSVC